LAVRMAILTYMDTVSPEERSRIMSHVKGRDTTPEKRVRSLLHSMGYRFRLQRADLPGKPDIVLPKFKTVIFVNGCFWHRHPGCKRATLPKSNAEFWRQKLEKNVARDRRNIQTLKDLGWYVLIIWECELKDTMTLQARLSDFFENHDDYLLP